jgi:hypothetical protein
MLQAAVNESKGMPLGQVRVQEGISCPINPWTLSEPWREFKNFYSTSPTACVL